jgi:hypothetical protein
LECAPWGGQDEKCRFLDDVGRAGDEIGALPSEHAKGDAIDVVSFVLADKRRVTVKALGPLVGALRMTACGYFTTVLGPGADPEHETHLHLDMLMHGGSANYRICE